MPLPTSEIQKLAPSALVEMFILDATPIGGIVHYFHAGTNALGEDLVWQGRTYSRFPIEAEGFDLRSSGTAPRPKIRASNIGGFLGAEVRAYGELLGSKLTRKRTFARYLDAVNFPNGNPSADPNVEIGDEVYYFDRKVSETNVAIEWELTSALDLVNQKLPRRQIIANLCPWKYRGQECNYTGGPVADAYDNPVYSRDQDVCGKRLSSCRLRFGTNGILRFGGFPAAALIRS
jgi:lambda family phage minor tail protein L